MALTLTIENEVSLADGGPLSIKVTGRRGLDIGRDQHLDWTLPDPTRYISGKHCEVRFKDGGYWLYDVSTNGTFLNGSDKRMQSPHRLRSGDRLVIGQYIVAVFVEGEEAERAPAMQAQPAASYDELWSPTADTAPPVDPSLLRTPRERARPVKADFLDWATDVPDVRSFAPDSRPAASISEPDMSWAQGPARALPIPEPAPPMPTPRRPSAAAGDANSSLDVWDETEAKARPGARPAVLEVPPPTPPLSRVSSIGSPIHPPGALHAAGAATSQLSDAADLNDFLRRLAVSAGLPEEALTNADKAKLADDVGAILRSVVENLRQLLSARRQAKQIARSGNQTTVEALDNNPLKFSPTAEDALRIMFGPATRSYLDARQALDQSFADVKAHQIKTFAAMQHALRRVVADLDPQAIAAEAPPERGLAAMVGSRNARLWDIYLKRWQAKASTHDGGATAAFMEYFAEYYDSAGKDIK